MVNVVTNCGVIHVRQSADAPQADTGRAVAPCRHEGRTSAIREITEVGPVGNGLRENGILVRDAFLCSPAKPGIAAGFAQSGDEYEIPAAP